MATDNEARNDRHARLEQASIDAAHEGLKALLLLNGGASIAVLGFLATTLKDATEGGFQALIAGMLDSLVWFAVGSGLAVFTSFCAYLSNQAYATSLLQPQVSWLRGTVWNRVGLAAALSSLGAFAYGTVTIAQTVPF